MAGKKGKEKKKKKGKKGGHIAAALMPTTSFTAVPRSPPPPPDPDVDMGLSSGILGSSMLTRMFGTNDPMDGAQTEETDTSLQDYLNAQGTLPYAGTMGSRGRIPTPPQGFGDDDTEFDDDTDPMYDEARDYRAVSPDPLYAQPMKGRRKASRSPSPYSPTPGAETDDSFFDATASQTYEPDDPRSSMGRASMRSTGSRRSRSGRQTPIEITIEERVESQMIDSSLRSAPHESSLRRSRPGSRTPSQKSVSMSMTTTPKLETLRAQNQEMISKQVTLETELRDQRELQKNLMSRLEQSGFMGTQNLDQTTTQEMGSILQETQNERRPSLSSPNRPGVTDQTIRKQEELMESIQKRTTVIEHENLELREINEQLQAEISSVRKMAYYGDDDEVGGQTSMLKKQLQDFKDECDTLKSAVQRLNGELGRYQAKYRPLTGTERDDIPGLPVRGPRPSWLVNTKYLAPLLIAYDDRLREKDEAIKQFEDDMEGLRNGIEEVIRENERIHIRLEQTDISGPLSMSEWKQLQEQCKLVLEENQLLMEQIDVQQNKAKDMHRAHVQEIAKLSKRVINAEADKNDTEVQMEAFKHKYSEMKREYDATVIENKSRLGMEDHLEAIASLKRALEEERSKHAEEISNFTNRFQSTNSDKKGIAIEMEDLKSQHKQLQGDLKTLHKINRKQQKKMHALQGELEMTQASDLTKEHYLTTVLKVAEKTATERDSLTVAMEEKERQKRTAINKLMADKVAVGKMEERLKMYKLKASEKVEKVVLRLKEQDHDFKGQQHEYEREIRHLRLLLKEKEELLGSMVGEKRQVEDDLETMWQVASADNRRMKDTLKRSMRKLKDHTNIAHMIEQEYDPDYI